MNVVMPIPDDAPPIPNHPSLGTPVARWTYRDPSGAPLFHVCRFEPNGSRKQVLPLVFDGTSWSWSMPVDSRPLYGLDVLATRPQAPVLIVEGEKTADAAANLFADFAVTTSQGGSNAAAKTDWSPLKGRTVTIWPDHDDAGRKYAVAVTDHLHAVGANVFTVDVPDDWSEKWDLADPLPDGADLRSMLKQARPVEPPESALEQILGATTLDELDVLLRKLRTDARGLDGIGRGLLRERCIHALRVAKVNVASPAKLADAALGPEPGACLDDGQRDMLLREIDPHTEPVDGAAMLDELREAVNRYLVLTPAADIGIALWIVHAHAHDAFPISPILAITSPVKRCGKTTVLELVQSLVPRPLPLNNITAAALFRVVEMYHPTLLVDEADTFFRDSDELRGVINSGHKRSMAYVLRTTGDDYEPTRFSTWSPKSIALIGRLPDTTEDRSIVVEMRRKTSSEKVARFNGDQTPKDLEKLAGKVARWVMDSTDLLRRADPAIPDRLHDRAADNWRPLLAIAGVAGGEWSTLAREAAVALSGADDGNEPSAVQALWDLSTMFSNQEVDRLTSEEIVKHFVTLEERPWPEYRHGKPLTKRQLATLLRKFGIVPKKIRTGPVTVRGYHVGDCADAFTRYIPRDDPEQRNNVDQHCASGEIRSGTEGDLVPDRASGKLNGGGDCSGVPLPQEGAKGDPGEPGADDDVEYF